MGQKDLPRSYSIIRKSAAAEDAALTTIMVELVIHTWKAESF